MSEEHLKAFLEAVKADEGLQDKLKAAGDLDAVVEIAKAAGFVISAEELKIDQHEVSEEELEGMSGGTALLVAATIMFCGPAAATDLAIIGGGIAAFPAALGWMARRDRKKNG